MPNVPHTPRARRTGWTCRPATRPPRRRSTPACSAGPTTTSPCRRGRCTRWPCSAATRSPPSPRSHPNWPPRPPPMWNTYLAVDSVDEAAGRVNRRREGRDGAVRRHGRRTDGIHARPLRGRGGAVAGQPAHRRHAGERAGRGDLERAGHQRPVGGPVLQRLLGITASTTDMGGGPYTLFEVGGQKVGGTAAPQKPGAPNHWHVYFAVADADAAAARVGRTGRQDDGRAVGHPGGPDRGGRRPAGSRVQHHQSVPQPR